MLLNWPLMTNNITREDLDVLVDFLRQDPMPILTQNKNVRAFEEEWSAWLGVKHSVFVNSGASANLITLAALKILKGGGEVILPTLTWSSDIVSVVQNGFTPVFVDIDLETLGMNNQAILQAINPNTRAVFLTHAQGLNALSDELLTELEQRGIPLIEDVCESHGTTHQGKKLGAFGWASNFSYYFAHHMSTIEGGMVCTNDDELYNLVRALRSHGMVREMPDAALRERWANENPELHPSFIFAHFGYNVRSTEINAVLGRNQLPRLDENNRLRTKNFTLFLSLLDKNKYFTEFKLEGSSNYAFNLILRHPDKALLERVCKRLDEAKVEYRRGSAGGGNQVRQPYVRHLVGPEAYKKSLIMSMLNWQ